jgi:hypothetical protein
MHESLKQMYGRQVREVVNIGNDTVSNGTEVIFTDNSRLKIIGCDAIFYPNLNIRDDGTRLHCYGSGDGTLEFVWRNGDTCIGRPVTKEEATTYLNSHEGDHLRGKWKVTEENSRPVLHRIIKRIDNTTLEIDGDLFTVAYAPDSQNRTRRILDHEVNVTATMTGRTFDVKNMSLRAVIRHFLEHENG